MDRLNPAKIFAILSFGLLLSAATPIIAAYLAIGWSWRLWVTAVSRTLHMALRDPSHSLVHR